MDYEKFVETIKEVVTSLCGNDMEIMVTHIKKNNGVTKTGLLMKRKETNMAPTIYLEDFYTDFQRGKSISEIADNIIKIYRHNQNTPVFLVEKFKDFNYIKHRIMYKIINKDRNQELLKECPHVTFLDLAVVPYVEFQVEDENHGTILIKVEHLSLWGISEEEIMSIAAKNTPELLQPKIRKMEDTIRELFEVNYSEPEEEVEEFLKEIEACEVKIPIYVLTNQRNLYGASCMLYEGVLEMFSEQIQEDVYILPSSIHEVLLVPASKAMEPKELSSMVQEINSTQMPVEEILSDNVYKYSMKERGFCIV